MKINIVKISSSNLVLLFLLIVTIRIVVCIRMKDRQTSNLRTDIVWMRNLDVRVSVDVFFFQCIHLHPHPQILTFLDVWKVRKQYNRLLRIFNIIPHVKSRNRRLNVDEHPYLPINDYRSYTILFLLWNKCSIGRHTSFLTIQHSRRIFSVTGTSGSMKKNHYAICWIIISEMFYINSLLSTVEGHSVCL